MIITFLLYILMISQPKIQGFQEPKAEEGSPKQQETPQKRRGRPQKKPQPFYEQGQQLFTIHDNVFHASILFYTFKIFDKAPTRKKFNPTIGFSVYEKVKNFPPELKQYYNDDIVAIKKSQQYSENFHLRNFFINCLTFGPKCVIDQFYDLFDFILSSFKQKEQPTVLQCILFINQKGFKYLNFDNGVLDFLQAKSTVIRQGLKEHIKRELHKLIQVTIHTLFCLAYKEKQNKFVHILQSDENMFERGNHTKSKKKIKKQ